MSHVVPGVPEGFRRADLSRSQYLDTNGPFWLRRKGGVVQLGVRVEARHCNSMGTLHGGMVLTFVDVGLTVCANIIARTSRFLVTLGVSCDFIGPARAGDWVQMRVDVLRTTRTYVFAQGLVETGSGQPVARASGTLLVRGEPDPQYDGERFFRD